MRIQEHSNIDEKCRDKLHHQLFEQVPCNIAVIDRDYKIVDMNNNFAEIFGDGIGKPCYEVYKNRSERCELCMAAQTFEDGEVRVNEEVGVDRNGQTAHYIVHMSPIVDDDGNIPYVVEMSTDVTETWRLKREYQVLFERVPCFVAVINRDLRIVRANELLRETFGETTGQHCFEVYKRRSEKCEDCPAEQTFRDGRTHTCDQIGIDKEGNTTNYVVTTSPLTKSDPNTSHLIEMALDVTENRHLEEKLAEANAFREMLIENSIHGVIATDPDEKVIIFNPAAEAILGYSASEIMGRRIPPESIPAEYRKAMEEGRETIEFQDVELEAKGGEKVPVRLSGTILKRGDRYFGHAAFIRDLREVKRLEQEKIDAERLAVVGQTVAGLAHGIKNILTGLEGGIYVFRSGLEKGQKDRMDQGWKMLERNINKISDLVKKLLSFSKGRVPDVKPINPADVARDVLALYEDSSRQSGVSIEAKIEDIDPAPFDPGAMHTCLANLVSNALDACVVSEKPDCRIILSCREKENEIIFEVADTGYGMDYEIKKKAFTSFFTTKGDSGTGLGLLVTRKITQEHGGKIQLESNPGQGSVFRLVFPRKRLPMPSSAESGDRLN